MKLEREDYENIIKQTRLALKEATISVKIFDETISMAKKELAKFPPKKKINDPPAGTG